jgi:hypothetical protein
LIAPGIVPHSKSSALRASRNSVLPVVNSIWASLMPINGGSPASAVGGTIGLSPLERSRNLPMIVGSTFSERQIARRVSQ